MPRNANGAYALPVGVASAPYLSDAQIQVAMADLGAEVASSPRSSQLTDLGGVGLTTGSGSAYALTLNTPWTILPTGLPLVFRAHLANTGPCTLSLNGKAALPLRLASGQDLAAGALLKGALYFGCLSLASFVASLFGNLTNGSNQVTGVTNTAGLVAGQVVTSASPGLPDGTTILSISGSTLVLSAAFNGASTTGSAITISGPEIILVSAHGGPPAVAPGLAAVGANQASALLLSAIVNEVVSVPASTGVMLPAYAGRLVTVVNAGANALNVYPQPGGVINSLALNAPFVVAPGTRATFAVVSALKAYS